MYTFDETVYVKTGYDATDLLLVGDLGGTRCNFAVVKADKKHVKLLISVHLLSKEITSFVDVVSWVLAHFKKTYGITLDRACFAGAGPIDLQGEVIYVTNLAWTIDAQELKAKTPLQTIKLINDFEAIGYGIDLIDQKDVVCICKGERAQKPKGKYHNKIVIGAGTGLGKNVLVWNENEGEYCSMPSEGGHADFPAHTQEEFQLVEFAKKNNKKKTVSWEDFLSGRGISTIYQFLLTHDQACIAHDAVTKNNYAPSNIALYRKTDACAKETFAWFACFYARCAKNFALEVLALDGVYLAGGIVAKHADLFQEELFTSEFLKHETMLFLLKTIPVYVVTDYSVSLYGAGIAYFR